MIIHEVEQGSPEWHAFRKVHHTASEASAMLGFSKYKTRTQLLDEKITGITEEIDERKQKLFDDGHKAEAKQRVILEEDLQCEFFPVTGTHDTNTKIAASLDGKTDLILSDMDFIFEHKLLNKDLVRFIEEYEDLPDTHWPQVEQQLYVSGSVSCIFIVSDGTRENSHRFHYVSKPERIKDVLDGWDQFEKDLTTHEPKEAAAKPKGEAPQELATLFMNVVGEVKDTNLPEIKAAALTVFDSINRDLKTDDDFASAEKTVKWCKDVEESLQSAKKSALAQTSTIDQLFKVVDELNDKARTIRLELDKLVKERKKSIKIEIALAGKKLVEEHYQGINVVCDGFLPAPCVDFNSAMKNKRTITSLQEACDGEVVKAKIEMNRHADIISKNLSAFDSLDKKHIALFADKRDLVLKDNDFILLEIKNRTDQFDAAEAKRIEDAKKAEEIKEQPKPTPRPASSSNVTPIKPTSTPRPSPSAMITALALYYGVSNTEAQEWLLTTDFNLTQEV